MALTNAEFASILEDNSKEINGGIEWTEDEDHSPAVEFRVEIHSDVGWPLFVRGSYNRYAGTLSYMLILKTDGRIYGLDMGKDHHNPECTQVGEKHKHSWTEQFRDKEAYVPEDITTLATEPVAVWEQFCAEAKIKHVGGRLAQPPAVQEELLL
ncbi:MAG: hypothetical protein U5S82_23180 [Gammaproteobacteria bacterium]|nr:hypothetical protein [Gammaproteobacteria bacterium]